MREAVVLVQPGLRRLGSAMLASEESSATMREGSEEVEPELKQGLRAGRRSESEARPVPGSMAEQPEQAVAWAKSHAELEPEEA